MSPLPELNLNLGMSKDPDFPFNRKGKEEIIIRTDSALRKYTISLTISDQEAGTIILQINGNEIEVPTYKLIVTDDKTEEIRSYQVTRDILRFVKTKNKKSWLSFFGFKKFDKASYLYENIPFEPKQDSIETFDISAYRKLSHDMLFYQLERSGDKMVIYAGDISNFIKPEHVEKYFIVVDNDQGKSFIGDILYREKFLKLTPKVELRIIKRKQVPMNFEYNNKGSIKKIIYL
ncbi:hypothetical protein [Chryseobacterium nepalense]|uniref:Uncharacterized protein n=1 Tax=Chryseobacterium nepalense TaxID=1854498 RepID=A0ABY4K1J2_9FLAO|nr:hypothetical protein [Chryseobacterium nepalense]UPQ74671.1 hypothetical protein M0D58_11485 [Chryseobacterium nepalense]